MVLKNLDVKQSLDQDSEEARKENKTLIVADQTFLEDEDTFNEHFSPDRPDQLSSNTGIGDYLGANVETERISSAGIQNRCESPPRKRPRRTTTATQSQGKI